MKLYMDRYILTHYIQGELSEEKMRLVEEWIAATAENKEIFKNFYFAQQASQDLTLIDSLNTDLALRRIKSIVQENKRKKSAQAPRQTRFVRWSAAVIVVPLLILAGYLLPHPSSPVPVHLIEIESNAGVVSSFVLPDSTRVWLNAGSKLSYPSNYSRENRWVTLSGEGYFKVKKGTSPFDVKIDSTYTIQVLGTTFNVQAYIEDQFIKTTLLQGSVRLTYLASNNRRQEYLLKEKESSFYQKASGIMEIRNTDMDVDTAWTTGQIVFDNHSIEQVIKVLSRHYHVQFKVLDKQIYQSVITGKFDNEPLPQILSYIQAATGIKSQFKKTQITQDGISKQEILLFK